MTQFLTTEKKIIAWLKKMNISDYRLVPDSEYGFVVDVDMNVDLRQKKLKAIPVKFNAVKGDFYCGNNNLTSLAGCPSTVGESFNCDDNCLTSLEHCPKEVGAYFSCDDNKLKTLRHVPQRINSNFFCSKNNLANLEFCPDFVDGSFFCENNPIVNLEFCPSSVSDDFFCNETKLGEASKITDFNEIYKIHQTYLSIKNEKVLLSQAIRSNSKCDKKNKI